MAIPGRLCEFVLADQNVDESCVSTRTRAVEWIEQTRSTFERLAEENPLQPYLLAPPGSHSELDLAEIQLLECLAQLVPNLAHFRSTVRKDAQRALLSLLGVFDPETDQKMKNREGGDFNKSLFGDERKHRNGWHDDAVRAWEIVAPCLKDFAPSFVATMETYYAHKSLQVRDAAALASTQVLLYHWKTIPVLQKRASIHRIIMCFEERAALLSPIDLRGSRQSLISCLQVLTPWLDGDLIHLSLRVILSLPHKSAAEIESSKCCAMAILDVNRTSAEPLSICSTFSSLLTPSAEDNYDLLEWTIHYFYSKLSPTRQREEIEELVRLTTPLLAVSHVHVRYGVLLCISSLLEIGSQDAIESIVKFAALLMNLCFDSHYLTRQLALLIISKLCKRFFVDQERADRIKRFKEQTLDQNSNDLLECFNEMIEQYKIRMDCDTILKVMTIDHSSTAIMSKLQSYQLRLCAVWIKSIDTNQPSLVQAALPLIHIISKSKQQSTNDLMIAIQCIFNSLQLTLPYAPTQLLHSTLAFLQSILDSSENSNQKQLALRIVASLPFERIDSVRVECLLHSLLLRNCFIMSSKVRFANYQAIVGVARRLTSTHPEQKLFCLAVLLCLGFADTDIDCVDVCVKSKLLQIDEAHDGALLASPSLLDRLASFDHLIDVTLERFPGIRVCLAKGSLHDAMKDMFATQTYHAVRSHYCHMFILLFAKANIHINTSLNSDRASEVLDSTQSLLEHEGNSNDAISTRIETRPTTVDLLLPFLSSATRSSRIGAVSVLIRSCFRNGLIQIHNFTRTTIIATSLFSIEAAPSRARLESGFQLVASLLPLNIPELNVKMVKSFLQPCIRTLRTSQLPNSTLLRAMHLCKGFLCQAISVAQETSHDAMTMLTHVSEHIDEIKDVVRNILTWASNDLLDACHMVYTVNAYIASYDNTSRSREYLDYLTGDLASNISDPLQANLNDSQLMQLCVSTIKAMGVFQQFNSRVLDILCPKHITSPDPLQRLEAAHTLVEQLQGVNTESWTAHSLWISVPLLADPDIKIAHVIRNGPLLKRQPTRLKEWLAQLEKDRNQNTTDRQSVQDSVRIELFGEMVTVDNGYRVDRSQFVNLEKPIEFGSLHFVTKHERASFAEQSSFDFNPMVELRDVIRKDILQMSKIPLISDFTEVERILESLRHFEALSTLKGAAFVTESEFLLTLEWTKNEETLGGSLIRRIIDVLEWVDAIESLPTNIVEGCFISLNTLCQKLQKIALFQCLDRCTEKISCGMMLAILAVTQSKREWNELLSGDQSLMLRNSLIATIHEHSSMEVKRQAVTVLAQLKSDHLLKDIMKLLELDDSLDWHDFIVEKYRNVLMQSLTTPQQQGELFALLNVAAERHGNYTHQAGEEHVHYSRSHLGTLLALAATMLGVERILEHLVPLLADPSIDIRKRTVKMIQNGWFGDQVKSELSPIASRLIAAKGGAIDQQNVFDTFSSMKAALELEKIRNWDYSEAKDVKLDMNSQRYASIAARYDKWPSNKMGVNAKSKSLLETIDDNNDEESVRVCQLIDARKKRLRYSRTVSLLPELQLKHRRTHSEIDLNSHRFKDFSRSMDALCEESEGKHDESRIDKLSMEDMRKLLSAVVINAKREGDNTKSMIESMIDELLKPLPELPNDLRICVMRRRHVLGMIVNMLMAQCESASDDDKTYQNTEQQKLIIRIHNDFERLQQVGQQLFHLNRLLRQQIIENLDQLRYTSAEPIDILAVLSDEELEKAKEHNANVAEGTTDSVKRSHALRKRMSIDLRLESLNWQLAVGLVLQLLALQTIGNVGESIKSVQLSNEINLISCAEWFLSMLNDEHDAVRRIAREIICAWAKKMNSLFVNQQSNNIEIRQKWLQFLKTSVQKCKNEIIEMRELRRRRGDRAYVIAFLVDYLDPNDGETSIIRKSCIETLIKLWDDDDRSVVSTSIEMIQHMLTRHEHSSDINEFIRTTSSTPSPLISAITIRLNQSRFYHKDKLQQIMEWALRRQIQTTGP